MPSNDPALTAARERMHAAWDRYVDAVYFCGPQSQERTSAQISYLQAKEAVEILREQAATCSHATLDSAEVA